MNQSTLDNYINLLKNKITAIDVDINNIAIKCVFPGCTSREGKFHLAIEKVAKSGRPPAYKCWKCEAHGSLHRLLPLFDISITDDGTEYLFDIEENKSLFDEVLESVRDYEEMALPEECISLNQNVTSMSGKKAIDYLLSRGLTFDDIERYNLGFCSTGDYAGRIIIPVYDYFSRLVFFIGRSIYSGASRKVLNPPRDIYGVGSHDFIYNIHNNINKKRIVINEGAFDSMTIDSVSTFGKTMTDTQFNIIKNMNAEEVVVMLDLDAKKQAYLLADRLLPYKKVFLCFLPEEEDPNSLGKEETVKLLAEAFPYSQSTQLLHLLNGS